VAESCRATRTRTRGFECEQRHSACGTAGTARCSHARRGPESEPPRVVAELSRRGAAGDSTRFVSRVSFSKPTPSAVDHACFALPCSFVEVHEDGCRRHPAGAAGESGRATLVRDKEFKDSELEKLSGVPGLARNIGTDVRRGVEILPRTHLRSSSWWQVDSGSGGVAAHRSICRSRTLLNPLSLGLPTHATWRICQVES
jgi:hypothetical protein